MNGRNARLGFTLFAIYLVLYGGFVFINAFAPQVMEQMPFAGINLAVLSGFGLIVSAFVLAAIYGLACKNDDTDQAETGRQETDRQEGVS